MPEIKHPPRLYKLERKTRETSISVSLNLDDSSSSLIRTGYGFFDHMLDLLSFWGDFSLNITCEGDYQVDAHHSVEDTGLCLGECLNKALGDKLGIERTGFGRVPMDESLTEVSIDLSGRPWLVWKNGEILPPVIAKEEKDVWREFYKSFCTAGKFNLHILFLYGENGHHLLESATKSCGMALRQAIFRTGNKLRSTKGDLD